MSELSYPLGKKGVKTSNYGPRWGRNHNGVDIGVPDGTDVLAVADGVVARSDMRDKNGYGNFICIEHDDIGGKTKFSCYAHLTKRLKEVGDEVTQGEIIAKSGGGQGKSGGAGSSTGPHLHFEIRNSLSGDFEDPWPYITGAAIVTSTGESDGKIDNKKKNKASLFGGKKIKIIAKPEDHAKRSTSDWQSSNAWDIKQEPGTPVYSLTNGKVVKKHESSGAKKNIFGTQLSINGTNGDPDIFYTHLEGVNLKTGDTVKPGDLIGKITRWDHSPENSHVHIGIANKKDIFDFMDSDGKIEGSDTSTDEEDTDTENTLDLKGFLTKFGSSFKGVNKKLKTDYETSDKTMYEEVQRIKDIMKKIL
jgi:murein DD-endopeptidase MepM/ murein hydrolase activator NlpD